MSNWRNSPQTPHFSCASFHTNANMKLEGKPKIKPSGDEFSQ